MGRLSHRRLAGRLSASRRPPQSCPLRHLLLERRTRNSAADEAMEHAVSLAEAGESGAAFSRGWQGLGIAIASLITLFAPPKVILADRPSRPATSF
jgi:hypothetical protein